ncbi:hypothetical protein OIE99_29470 [Streptomyces cellulosae]|nr:hypothetical protein OIE99_29470 [Streptomyces cellulosae]
MGESEFDQTGQNVGQQFNADHQVFLESQQFTVTNGQHTFNFNNGGTFHNHGGVGATDRRQAVMEVYKLLEEIIDLTAEARRAVGPDRRSGWARRRAIKRVFRQKSEWNDKLAQAPQLDAALGPNHPAIPIFGQIMALSTHIVCGAARLIRNEPPDADQFLAFYNWRTHTALRAHLTNLREQFFMAGMRS